MDKYKNLYKNDRKSFPYEFSNDPDIVVQHLSYTDEELVNKPDFIRRNRVMGDATSLSHPTVFGAMTYDMDIRSVYGFIAFKKSTCATTDPDRDVCFPTKFLNDKKDENPLDLFTVSSVNKHEFVHFMMNGDSQDAFYLVL